MSEKSDIVRGVVNENNEDVKPGQRLHMIFEAMTGRKMRMTDSYAAVGLGKSRYNQLTWEELTQPTRLRRAAEALEINVVALMVKCGQIDPSEAVEYVDESRRELREFFGDSDFSQEAREGVTTTAVAPTTTKLTRTKIKDLKPRREVPPV